MRQMLTVLALIGLAAPALAAEPQPTPQQSLARQRAEALARCQYQVERAAKADEPKGPMKLTEAPPARMELAVNRRINGCPVPVIVRNDVEKK